MPSRLNRAYRRCLPGVILTLACILQGCTNQQAHVPDRVDYNFNIRPILSNTCYVCHGPDVSTREADLRLDVREEAIRKRDGGRAIVPGSARRSLLIQKVTAEDPDNRMPPAEANKTLTPREIALLSRWIDQGAEYKPHWALIPPTPREAPSGSSTAIDGFVNARLEARDLPAAPPATRESLVRRASYVLTGLPPSPALVRSFTNDSSPDAYASLIDTLLASPGFGERWARHWMDLMRYAESKGHEFDFTIDGAWQYRDYLIRAFNADVPYDRLVAEHLAGDLLDTPRYHPLTGTDESVIGTVYYALGEGKHSPVDNRIDEAERIDNIIDVTTKTFQGLTLACARCHDHKFDPLPTADYYSFYGMVESARFAPTALLSSHQRVQLDSIRAIQSALRRHIATTWIPALEGAPARLSSTRPAGATPSIAATPDSAQSWRMLGDFRNGAYDGWFAHGPAFEEPTALGAPVTTRGRFDSLLTGVASSRQLAAGVPGALRSPTFTIEHDSLHVEAAGHKSSIRIIVDNFQLIRAPIHGGLDVEVTGPELSTYRFDVAMWKGRKAYVELLVGTYTKKERFLTEQHRLLRDPSSYIEAAYAITFNGDPPVMTQPALPREDLAGAVDAWASGAASQAQVATINAALRRGQLPASPLRAALRKVDAIAAELQDAAYVLTVTDGDNVTSPVFDRGNYRMLTGSPVPHRFFTALVPSGKPFTASASGRLDLAESITNPDNPLTARVMVNRLWHHVFGRGIVKTVDNFGAQGALPTHPELLDYLALRFMGQDWSIKAMLREILLSETFRRSTQASPEAMETDPENLLWSHYPIRRLEAEAIRDGILAVSGRLDSTMYGEPVPIHLTEFMEGRGRPQESGPLDGDGRRSIYISVRRNFLSPMMLAYDRPLPFSTFGARNSSNVPAQSLTMLNDPFVAEQADTWAQRIVAMDLDTLAKIEYIYMRALSRPPTPEETANARIFLDDEAQRMELDAEAAENDPGLWAAFCHVVFNLKEFIYLI